MKKINFNGTSALDEAERKRRQAEEAYSNLTPFRFENQDLYEKARDSVLNREEFKYDVNADEVYKTYKDIYERQGNLAMKDTAGQVAAMSGGYGNSYAQTAGQQIYNAYMDELGGKIPELYQMAYNQYQAEGDRLAQNYSLLANERQNAYNEHLDARNVLLADRDYYNTNYNNLYNSEFQDYWNRENLDYQRERDAVSDAQWQKTFDYQSNQDALDRAWQEKVFNYQAGQDAIANAQRRATASTPSYMFTNSVEFEDYIIPSNEFYDKAKKGTWQTDKIGTSGETKYTFGSVDYNNYKDYVGYQVMSALEEGLMSEATADDIMTKYNIDPSKVRKHNYEY